MFRGLDVRVLAPTWLKAVVTAEAVRAIAFASIVVTRGVLTARIGWQVAVEAGNDAHMLATNNTRSSNACSKVVEFTMAGSPWVGHPLARAALASCHRSSMLLMPMPLSQLTTAIAPVGRRGIVAAPWRYYLEFCDGWMQNWPSLEALRRSDRLS
jgi:hypothetical protein